MNWYVKVLQNYVGFSGRARRKEYWMFALVNFIIGLVFALLMQAADVFGLISNLYSLAVLLPSLAVSIRRLHDTGRSGWWLLISLIPIVGFIVLLVFFCQDSQSGENQYGENPKAGLSY
ncbi:DUF805 domain-containing protein [Ectobacillus ponti]|uniref:DUF805 domain-containing protein n=1 Tax=Ectobacillus ponti TaxID=2961894 RepID=A0AA41X770_9BACI|nr:DUF805 domain-containing protein [Ectobacillus ponti]MCP8968105.1 DUF805 domain-containing protein [Ectobacillus ponti]